MSRAPRLTRKLVLQGPQLIPDESGGFATTWQTLGTLWADIRAGSGRVLEEDGLPRTSVPLKITVRAAPVAAPSRPHAGQRFVEQGRKYRILAVADADGSARYLVCHAEEEVTP